MQFSKDIKLYVNKRTLQALASIFYDDCVDSWMIYEKSGKNEFKW